LRQPITERFWSHVRKGEGCWEWTAFRRGHGAGYGWLKKTPPTKGYVLAHRFAWELADGYSIPTGQHVLHACDNPACVRNDEAGVYVLDGVEHPKWGHLFLGSNGDNCRDRHAKGRTARGDSSAARLHPELCARGERTAHSRLTAAQVLEIRGLWVTAAVNISQLSRQFGVHRSSIRKIVEGKAWAHLLPVFPEAHHPEWAATHKRKVASAR